MVSVTISHIALAAGNGKSLSGSYSWGRRLKASSRKDLFEQQINTGCKLQGQRCCKGGTSMCGQRSSHRHWDALFGLKKYCTECFRLAETLNCQVLNVGKVQRYGQEMLSVCLLGLECSVLGTGQDPIMVCTGFVSDLIEHISNTAIKPESRSECSQRSFFQASTGKKRLFYVSNVWINSSHLDLREERRKMMGTLFKWVDF